MKYKVILPDGKVQRYEDINRAAQAAPNGSTIVNTETGARYTVTK